MSRALSIGVSDSDTNADISTAPAMMTPNSRKSLPTNPCRNMMGRKTAASVMEVETTAKKISRDPANAASIGLRPSSTFLNMFSVTTMPSSTTRPVARTIARSVRMFIENPITYMMKNAPTSDTGMSIRGRMAMIHSRKKR